MPLEDEQFCIRWETDERELARMRAEPHFIAAVAGELLPWLDKIADLRNAVLKNALDPARKDQWRWMKRYEAMLGLSLLPDEAEAEDE